jgi:hypothetical protein
MPEISRFFGIIIYMYHGDHNPPHIHAIYQGKKVMIDFQGNILRGGLDSKTATRLIRDRIDTHFRELTENWNLSQAGKSLMYIEPLE